jgi:hypothetical protein
MFRGDTGIGALEVDLVCHSARRRLVRPIRTWSAPDDLRKRGENVTGPPRDGSSSSGPRRTGTDLADVDQAGTQLIDRLTTHLVVSPPLPAAADVAGDPCSGGRRSIALATDEPTTWRASTRCRPRRPFLQAAEPDRSGHGGQRPTDVIDYRLEPEDPEPEGVSSPYALKDDVVLPRPETTGRSRSISIEGRPLKAPFPGAGAVSRSRAAENVEHAGYIDNSAKTSTALPPVAGGCAPSAGLGGQTRGPSDAGAKPLTKTGDPGGDGAGRGGQHRRGSPRGATAKGSAGRRSRGVEDDPKSPADQPAWRWSG